MSASIETGHLVAPLLREAWPRNAAKMAARAANAPFETARKWVTGYAIPSAETLLRMAAEDDALADALARRIAEARRARAAAAEGLVKE